MIKVYGVSGKPLKVNITISNSIWKFIMALVIILFIGIPFYLLIGSIAALHLGWWYVLIIPAFFYVQLCFLLIGYGRLWILYGMNKEINKVLEEVRTKQGLPPRVV